LRSCPHIQKICCRLGLGDREARADRQRRELIHRGAAGAPIRKLLHRCQQRRLRPSAIITGSGRKAALTPAFKWVNTTLRNIKSAITGTYRAVRDKHVPRYLAEFEYRFNRRYDLAAVMPRLGYVAVRTPAHAIPSPQAG
jgi:hypothetical protein